MVTDPGYDDHVLYELNTILGFQIVCPLLVDTEIHLCRKILQLYS